VQRSTSGRFIVIEGPDGSGSSTQVACVAASLRARGERVLTTREPSEGPIGLLLRQVLRHRLVNSDGSAINESTMALLFSADRLDHLNNQVIPALDQGITVVCDRYLLSTLAYQSQLEDLNWLIVLNQHARMPDLTVVLDVPAEESLRRIEGSRASTERYETVDQLTGIRAAFRRLAEDRRLYPGRTRVIDGTQAPEAVTRAIEDEYDALGTE
jgi:dTMP kinase